MTKYNKSEIFKKAWNIFRKCEITFSKALKLAWADAKTVVENVKKVAEESEILFEIKDWFYWKNAEKLRFQNGCVSRYFEKSDVVKETEKAYCAHLEVESHDGEHTLFYTNVWIPKSCVVVC